MLTLLLWICAAANAGIGATVEGLVADTDDGSPLPGVTVRLTSAEEDRRLIAATTADENGAFLFRDVAPGFYCVATDSRCGADDSDLPWILETHSGELIDDVLLRQARIDKAVSGTILDDDGKPISGARIGLDFGKSSVASDDAGHFAIQTPNRASLLFVQAKGYATMMAVVGTEGAALEFRLPRLGSIAGQVLDTRGRPVAGKGIRFRGSTDQPDYTSPDFDPKPHALGGGCHSAETDREGRFKADGLPPDLYEVRFIAEETAEKCGGYREHVAPCSPAQCELKTGEIIEGLLVKAPSQDDLGALDLEVVDANTGEPLRDSRSDLESPSYEGGHVRAKCIPSGSLKVAVTANHYITEQIEVIVKPHKTTHKTVRLQPIRDVRGTVTPAPDKEMNYAEVMQFVPGEKRPTATAHVDPDGSYVLSGARSGRSLIVARRFDTGQHRERWESKWVTLGTSPSTEANFDLRAPAGISGKVTCPLGCSGELVIRAANAPDPVPWHYPIALHEQVIGQFSFWRSDSTSEEFSILNLPPGEYKVTAGWHSNHEEERHDVQRAVLLKAGEITPLELACCEPGEEEITLAPGSIPGTLVEGIVVDAAIAKPLSGVIVRICTLGDREHSRDMATDNDGRFSFRDLPAGAYCATAVPPEGAAVFGPKHPYVYRCVRLESTGGIRNLRFKISFVSTTLSGRVYDEKGNPVAGATIKAARAYMMEEPNSGPGAIEGVTDAEGQYCLRGLCMTQTPTMRSNLREDWVSGGPGETSLTYRFQATAPGHTAKYTTRAFDNTPTAKMNFRLCTGACLAGRILSAQGEPHADQWVRLDREWGCSPILATLSREICYRLIQMEGEGRSEHSEPMRKTDSEGRFRFDCLGPNRYTLVSDCVNGKEARCTPFPVELAEAQSVQRDFTETIGGDLYVTIRDEMMGFIGPDRIEQLRLAKADGSLIDASYTYEKNWRFAFKNKQPGEITCYVKAAGCEPVQGTANIASGREEYLELVVRGSEVLTGHVVPAEPLREWVTSYIHGNIFARRAEVEPAGDYRLEKLHEGTYLFSATRQDVHQTGVRVQSKWITLEKGKGAKADFDLSGSASISGEFTFPEGYHGIVIVCAADAPDPIPWNDRPRYNEHLQGTCGVGENSGQFELPFLLPGDYKVTAAWFKTDEDKHYEKKDIHEVTRSVSLAEGEHLKLDIEGK